MPYKSFSKWKSKSIETSVYEKDLLKTGKINKRVYFNNQDFVWYVLVESLHGHHGQHQPEVCYTGNGWVVEKRENIYIKNSQQLIKAKILLLHRRKEYRLAVYWYGNGNMTTGNFYERVFQHVWDDWSNNSYSAWTFHRVSIPVVGDLRQGLQSIKSFIKDIKFTKNGEII